MICHSILSGDISLPKCTKTSILELLTVLTHHGSVVSIGDEHQCGLVIMFHRCVGYALRFLRVGYALRFVGYALRFVRLIPFSS